MSLALYWLTAVAFLTAMTLGMIATIAVALCYDYDWTTLDSGRWYIGLDSEATPLGRFVIIGLGRWAIGILPLALAAALPPSDHQCELPPEAH